MRGCGSEAGPGRPRLGSQCYKKGLGRIEGHHFSNSRRASKIQGFWGRGLGRITYVGLTVCNLAYRDHRAGGGSGFRAGH